MSCSLKVPAVRVWRGLSARLGLLRPCRAARAGDAAAGLGLGRLRKEVRTFDYDDVHVMWEMLSSRPSDGSKGAAPAMAVAAVAARRARTGWKPAAAAWSRLAFYCCGL